MIMPRAQRIAITGASQGLGAALARQYAGPGVTFFLCARDVAATQQLTSALEAKGACVNWTGVDVSVTARVTDWVASLWRTGPIDLLILNAGIFDGRSEDGALESPDRARALIDTNLNGAIAPALVAVDLMLAAGFGQIVFISSLASLTPLADAPVYSASKAGLTAFARALQKGLSGTGLRVTIVHPGHIQTSQTTRHIGALPGMCAPDDAARRIAIGIARGQAEINFPVILVLGIWLSGLLPRRLQVFFDKPFRFRVRRP
jgi:short-subunit dehydrogenase